MGLEWSIPPEPDSAMEARMISPMSVKPQALADFYISIFNQWIHQDVGRQFVQFFEAALGNFLGAEPGLCQYSATCGHAAALEYNGDLYSCDHYVYPAYRPGNILSTPMEELLNSDRQRSFGMSKHTSLPHFCRDCDVLFACHGECPKNRFMKTPDGEFGLNYLCAGYKRIYHYLMPYLEMMAKLIRMGQPVHNIMNILAKEERDKRGHR